MAGETASIALALKLGATVVLDDRKARRYASARGLEVVETLGLLMLVHRSGRAGSESGVRPVGGARDGALAAYQGGRAGGFGGELKKLQGGG